MCVVCGVWCGMVWCGVVWCGVGVGLSCFSAVTSDSTDRKRGQTV